MQADVRGLLAFDPLGDDLDAQPGDRRQERPNHFPARLGALHGLNQTSIQLEKMRRTLGDFQQPGLAGPEVVIGDLDSQLFQPSLQRPQLGDTGRRLLGDFDDKLATVLFSPGNLVERNERGGPAQLGRVEIDEETEAARKPCPDLHRLGPEETAQIALHLTFLGEFKELGGALMQLVMPAAAKGLEPDDLAGPEIDDRLKEDGNRFVRDQLAKLVVETNQAFLLVQVGPLSQ